VTQTTPCARCGRTIEFEDDASVEDEVVCMGCLTSEEDVDDTLAFIDLLKRKGDPEAAGGLSEAALENLQRRQESGEPVRRALTTEPDAAPADVDRVERSRDS
jgi:hypothetical protein